MIITDQKLCGNRRQLKSTCMIHAARCGVCLTNWPLKSLNATYYCTRIRILGMPQLCVGIGQVWDYWASSGVQISKEVVRHTSWLTVSVHSRWIRTRNVSWYLSQFTWMMVHQVPIPLQPEMIRSTPLLPRQFGPFSLKGSQSGGGSAPWVWITAAVIHAIAIRP